ncbi:hypothetical protein QE152_g6927 [Popillia japonica]|uniref:Uncharacterized protein n=1 Tax=Popillia japonica TaxID=7064 RepID=A0AAW1MD55_POPJA
MKCFNEIFPLLTKRLSTEQARNGRRTQGAVEVTSSPYTNHLKTLKAVPSKVRRAAKQLGRLKPKKTSSSEKKNEREENVTDKAEEIYTDKNTHKKNEMKSTVVATSSDDR